jgi:ribosome-associated translation inhibitor RaiA/cold shock CspA family protein
MQQPLEIPILEITIRDIENTEAIDAKIRKESKKLHQFYDRITSCRVVVKAAQKNKHQGKEFQVKIKLSVPGKVLVVKRQLEDYTHKLRGAKKNHKPHLTGEIVRLFSDYGFIETPDGNEYYFHQTNVIQPAFSQLIIGGRVQFLESVMGGDSLQAHLVTGVDAK